MEGGERGGGVPSPGDNCASSKTGDGFLSCASCKQEEARICRSGQRSMFGRLRPLQLLGLVGVCVILLRTCAVGPSLLPLCTAHSLSASRGLEEPGKYDREAQGAAAERRGAGQDMSTLGDEAQPVEIPLEPYNANSFLLNGLRRRNGSVGATAGDTAVYSASSSSPCSSLTTPLSLPSAFSAELGAGTAEDEQLNKQQLRVTGAYLGAAGLQDEIDGAALEVLPLSFFQLPLPQEFDEQSDGEQTALDDALLKQGTLSSTDLLPRDAILSMASLQAGGRPDEGMSEMIIDHPFVFLPLETGEMFNRPDTLVDVPQPSEQKMSEENGDLALQSFYKCSDKNDENILLTHSALQRKGNSSLSPSSSSTEDQTASSLSVSSSPSKHSSGIVLKCRFRTGDPQQDRELPSFFIPFEDKELYEHGVEMLSQMTPRGGREEAEKNGSRKAGSMGAAGSAAPSSSSSSGSGLSLSIYCVQVDQVKDLECRLCIYNEVSTDRKHLRQGQVLDTKLQQCMSGSFLQGGRMRSSTFHPICYPPETSGRDSAGSSGRFAASPSSSSSIKRTKMDWPEDTLTTQPDNAKATQLLRLLGFSKADEGHLLVPQEWPASPPQLLLDTGRLPDGVAATDASLTWLVLSQQLGLEAEEETLPEDFNGVVVLQDGNDVAVMTDEPWAAEADSGRVQSLADELDYGATEPSEEVFGFLQTDGGGEHLESAPAVVILAPPEGSAGLSEPLLGSDEETTGSQEGTRVLVFEPQEGAGRERYGGRGDISSTTATADAANLRESSSDLFLSDGERIINWRDVAEGGGADDEFVAERLLQGHRYFGDELGDELGGMHFAPADTEDAPTAIFSFGGLNGDSEEAVVSFPEGAESVPEALQTGEEEEDMRGTQGVVVAGGPLDDVWTLDLGASAPLPAQLSASALESDGVMQHPSGGGGGEVTDLFSVSAEPEAATGFSSTRPIGRHDGSEVANEPNPAAVEPKQGTKAHAISMTSKKLSESPAATTRRSYSSKQAHDRTPQKQLRSSNVRFEHGVARDQEASAPSASRRSRSASSHVSSLSR